MGTALPLHKPYIAFKLDIHLSSCTISIFIFCHKSWTTEPVRKHKVITRTNISKQGWDDTYPQPCQSILQGKIGRKHWMIISTWNSECFVVHQTTESRFIKSLHSLHHLHHWPKGFICSHGLIHQKLWWWKEKIEVSNTVLWCQHVNNLSKFSDQKHLNIEHQNIIKPTFQNNRKPGLTRAIAEVTKWQALQKEEVCYPPVYGNWQWSGAGKADHT